MLDAGLTADEVTALKANLAKDYTVETEAPAEETPEEPVPQPRPTPWSGRLPVEHRPMRCTAPALAGL